MIKLSAGRDHNFLVGMERLSESIKDQSPDCVILVNPNNPTGEYFDSDKLKTLIRNNPGTFFWVDETYIDYLEGGETLESFACTMDNVIVVKSLSKIFALSGLRVAYAVSSPTNILELDKTTPPWIAGTLAQLAAIEALRTYDYYRNQIGATNRLRREVVSILSQWDGVRVHCAAGNFIFLELLESKASRFQTFMENERIFIRDFSHKSPAMDGEFIRIAIRSPAENKRILNVFSRFLRN